MSDITVNVDGYRVNLRVGAIVSQEDKILICRMRHLDWWFLPGGRIKVNESSRQALKRELHEEIGDSFEVGTPFLCSENFFELNGDCFHEFCTYYNVQWLGPAMFEQDEDVKEVFAWITREEVAQIDLRPAFLKSYIMNPSANLELVIYRDGE